MLGSRMGEIESLDSRPAVQKARGRRTMDAETSFVKSVSLQTPPSLKERRSTAPSKRSSRFLFIFMHSSSTLLRSTSSRSRRATSRDLARSTSRRCSPRAASWTRTRKPGSASSSSSSAHPPPRTLRVTASAMCTATSEDSSANGAKRLRAARTICRRRASKRSSCLRDPCTATTVGWPNSRTRRSNFSPSPMRYLPVFFPPYLFNFCFGFFARCVSIFKHADARSKFLEFVGVCTADLIETVRFRFFPFHV